MSTKVASVLVGSAFVGSRNGAQAGSPLRQRVLGAVAPMVTGFCSIAAADTADRVLALTFDDGPDPASTPAILRVLAQHGTMATFFMLACKAVQHPELARLVAAEGHEIALHGNDHTRLNSLPRSVSRQSIAEGKRRLEAVVDRPIRLFRPPYGAQRMNEVLAARRQGLETVIWNVWAEDWRDQAASDLAERVGGACEAGTILLLHDGFEPEEFCDTSLAPAFDKSEALELLLGQLQRRQLVPGTVSQLLDGRTRVLVPWIQR